MRFTKPERDALVVAVRWAQDAPHHQGCEWRHNTDLRHNPYPCTCGRDEALKGLEADRG